MKYYVYVSSLISEIINYFEPDEFDIELVETPVKIIQLHSLNMPSYHFIFCSKVDEEVSNYIKENDENIAVVNIKLGEVDPDFPSFMMKYNLSYFEMSSLKEFSEFFRAFTQELFGNKESQEDIMHQRQVEEFKSNELWLKFLGSIPGVSRIKAEAIARVYSNFPKLLLAYSEIEENLREDMLKDIPTGSVTIGKVISKRIYKYINASDPKMSLL